jgi:hypothetical protein
MTVFVVVAVYQGVPGEVRTLTSAKAAHRRGYQLASQFNLVRRPWDWCKEDGRWSPKRGSTRFWEHHWYNDESDVFVARCDLPRSSRPKPEESSARGRPVE